MLYAFKNTQQKENVALDKASKDTAICVEFSPYLPWANTPVPFAFEKNSSNMKD